MNAQLLEAANTSLGKKLDASLGLKLVNTATAADILGAEPATLVIWRCTKRYDLPYVKIGRLVMYDLRDIAEFVKRRKIWRTEPAITQRGHAQTGQAKKSTRKNSPSVSS
jgi:hypothetical protein